MSSARRQPLSSGLVSVYRIRNQANGKRYIGKTTRSLGQRFEEHKSKALNNSKEKLYCAMRKHGIASFAIELIKEVATESEAYVLERHFIKQENTREHGYNMTDGGETPDPELARKSAIEIWTRPEFREKRRQIAIHKRRSKAASKAAKVIWAARRGDTEEM